MLSEILKHHAGIGESITVKRKVIVIGIGAGNPDYITVQAINALNQVSVFFIPNKGTDKSELARLRREICDRYIEGQDYRMVDFDTPERVTSSTHYKQSIAAWREEVEQVYERLLVEELSEHENGAFLVWGDPSLYDGTLRILENIRSRQEQFELEYDVIPGISSVQALAASHKIALGRIGESIMITTGRRLAEGFPNNVDNVTVMLDSQNTFKSLDGDLDIHWGAYAGTEDEILVSGKLRDVCDEIERLRADARDCHGWIMDSYILSKPESSKK